MNNFDTARQIRGGYNSSIEGNTAPKGKSYGWIITPLRWLAILPAVIFCNIAIGAINSQFGWLGELFIAWVYPLTAIPFGASIAPSHRVITSYVLAVLLGWPILIAPFIWAVLGYTLIKNNMDFAIDPDKIREVLFFTLASVIGCFSVVKGLRMVKESEK